MRKSKSQNSSPLNQEKRLNYKPFYPLYLTKESSLDQHSMVLIYNRRIKSFRNVKIKNDCSFIDLSLNNLTDFTNFPPSLPDLTALILDSNQIVSFNGIQSSSFPKLRFLSLKQNPISQNIYFKLMCLIVFGSQLHSINGEKVNEPQRQNANKLRKLLFPDLIKGKIITNLDPLRFKEFFSENEIYDTKTTPLRKNSPVQIKSRGTFSSPIPYIERAPKKSFQKNRIIEMINDDGIVPSPTNYLRRKKFSLENEKEDQKTNPVKNSQRSREDEKEANNQAGRKSSKKKFAEENKQIKSKEPKVTKEENNENRFKKLNNKEEQEAVKSVDIQADEKDDSKKFIAESKQDDKEEKKVTKDEENSACLQDGKEVQNAVNAISGQIEGKDDHELSIPENKEANKDEQKPQEEEDDDEKRLFKSVSKDERQDEQKLQKEEKFLCESARKNESKEDSNNQEEEEKHLFESVNINVRKEDANNQEEEEKRPLKSAISHAGRRNETSEIISKEKQKITNNANKQLNKDEHVTLKSVGRQTDRKDERKPRIPESKHFTINEQKLRASKPKEESKKHLPKSFNLVEKKNNVNKQVIKEDQKLHPIKQRNIAQTTKSKIRSKEEEEPKIIKYKIKQTEEEKEPKIIKYKIKHNDDEEEPIITKDKIEQNEEEEEEVTIEEEEEEDERQLELPSSQATNETDHRPYTIENMYFTLERTKPFLDPNDPYSLKIVNTLTVENEQENEQDDSRFDIDHMYTFRANNDNVKYTFGIVDDSSSNREAELSFG